MGIAKTGGAGPTAPTRTATVATPSKAASSVPASTATKPTAPAPAPPKTTTAKTTAGGATRDASTSVTDARRAVEATSTRAAKVVADKQPATNAKDGARLPGTSTATKAAAAVGAAASAAAAGAAGVVPDGKPVAPRGKAAPATPSAKPTDASTLDAAVPAAQRDAAIAADKAARAAARREANDEAKRFGENGPQVEHGQLAAYYAEHPQYVDPATGRVYAVTYDEKTGELTGTRTADQPLSPEPAGKGLGDVIGGLGLGLGHGLKPAPAAGEQTTTIVVQPNGSVVAEQAGPDRSREDEQPPLSGTSQAKFSYGTDGVLITGSSGSSLSGPNPGGGERTATSRTEYGAGGVKTATSTRDVTTRADGSSYHDGTDTDYRADGTPATSLRLTGATENGVTSLESHTVELGRDGQPSSEIISRTLTSDGPLGIDVTQRQEDRLTYDDHGQVVELHSDYPDDQRGALNDRLAQLAPDSDTRPSFAFGQVEGKPEQVKDDAGVLQFNEDGTPKMKSGVISGPGAAIDYHGVHITLEGADPGLDYPLHTGSVPRATDGGMNASDSERLDLVRSQVDGLPPQIREDVKEMRFLFQPTLDTGGTVAWASGGELTFPHGLAPDSVVFHESAHAADSEAGSGAQGRPAYEAAITSDEASRNAILDSIPADATVTGARGDLMHRGPGVTDYGTDTITKDDNIGEDWAESTMLYLESKRDGKIMTVTNADGTTRDITFEQLYPARAALLDSYYAGLDGWTPGEPQFAGEAVDRNPRK
ncbi:MAG: hypothetical protein JWM98_1538 [Thermoleophilia bacterium]|nr:hypothetical protein [Thermoleophilia bacterium]